MLPREPTALPRENNRYPHGRQKGRSGNVAGLCRAKTRPTELNPHAEMSTSLFQILMHRLAYSFTTS